MRKFGRSGIYVCLYVCVWVYGKVATSLYSQCYSDSNVICFIFVDESKICVWHAVCSAKDISLLI